MNEFKYYVNEGKVKKREQDKELAKSLLNDARQRAEKTKMLDVNTFSKMIFENIYDALRDLLDALLAIDGYKSYSHEASIAYLKKYKIEDSVIVELDNFRFRRNASKYYGKEIPVEDANEITDFYNKYSEKIISLVEEKIK